MIDNKVKVLICDDSSEYGVRIASQLREKGMYAYTRRNEQTSIINSVLADDPDVVVTDISLKDTDAIAVIKRVRSLMSECPKFIVISDTDNSFVKRQIIENGADSFMTAPVDVSELSDVIRSLSVNKLSPEELDTELMITEMVRSFGIPANLKGYRYLRTAVLECLEHRQCVDGVTKTLYPRVAEKYDTTPSRVERAIRHAIELAWVRADEGTINSFFGYKVDMGRSRPTNSEFIALAADKVALRMKSRRKFDGSLSDKF